MNSSQAIQLDHATIDLPHRQSTVVCILDIDINITRKLAIFISDHGGAIQESGTRNLAKRNLRSRRSADKNGAHTIHAIAKVLLIAHVDLVAFSTFDILGDISAADAR